MRYSLTFGEQLQKSDPYFLLTHTVESDSTDIKDIIAQTRIRYWTKLNNQHLAGISCWKVNERQYTLCFTFVDPKVKSIRGFVFVEPLPTFFEKCKATLKKWITLIIE